MARDARRTDPQAHARASSKGGCGAGGMGTAEASRSAGMGGGASSYMPATIQLYIQLSVNGGRDRTPPDPVPRRRRTLVSDRSCWGWFLRMYRNVADTIAQHFTRHGSRPPLAPNPATIDRLITAAFWASVRREEGRTPTISLGYLPREEAGNGLFVERQV